MDSIFALAYRPKHLETMICSLVNQFYCVHQSRTVQELATTLKNVSEIWAIGVVNDEMKAIGIIVATQFHERIGRPFGLDVLGRKPVTEVLVEARSFPFDTNILSVSEELADEVRKTSNQYYLAEDAEGKFAGIFSTKDLLIHQFNEHRRDIDLAAAIQQAVVPERSSAKSAKLEAFASSSMAKGVGGDFLALKESKPGTWVMTVCDVSGKGSAASLVTAALGGMFALYDADRGLASFIAEINSFVLGSFKMEKYLTGVFVEFDEARMIANLCDMGHSYVGIVRGGAILKFPVANPYVGFVPNLVVRGREIELSPDDLFFAYTDGFVEQMNAGGEEFGVEAFEGLLVAGRDRPLQELSEDLHGKIREFRGNAPRGDDEALLLVRIL